MPKRMISQDIINGDIALDLSVEERFFLMGLYLVADDQGRFRANPLWLRSQIFPYDNYNADQISAMLSKVGQVVNVYEVDGRQYGQIANWWESQSLRYAKESDYPAPYGWSDRVRVMVYEPKRWIKTMNWPGSDDRLLYNALNNELHNKSNNASNSDIIQSVNNNININNNSNITDNAESKPKKAKKTTPNGQSLLVEALAEVMDIPADPFPRKLLRTASALRKNKILGVEVTPELIRELYGSGGWYYQHDWRGKNGQSPSQDVFMKTIQKAIRWKLNPNPPRQGRKASAVTSSSTTAKPRRVAPGAV